MKNLASITTGAQCVPLLPALAGTIPLLSRRRASPAGVAADQSDCPPGRPAPISRSGFQPGEPLTDTLIP